jgi:hypothetical protein
MYCHENMSNKNELFLRREDHTMQELMISWMTQSYHAGINDLMDDPGD